jgi:hypothetical protein
MKTDGLTALAKRMSHYGFAVRCFDEAAEVAEAFRAILDGVATVGFGGSATLRQLGLDRVVESHGLVFYDHWRKGLSPDDVWQRRLAQGRADLFVTSANALTRQGQLVLTDGVGNRLTASVFGPRKVLFVVGENKIVADLSAVFDRICTIAAPCRAAELNLDVPCVKTGVCAECNSPARVCRSTLILERPSMGLPTAVWLVRGSWGF